MGVDSGRGLSSESRLRREHRDEAENWPRHGAHWQSKSEAAANYFFVRLCAQIAGVRIWCAHCPIVHVPKLQNVAKQGEGSGVPGIDRQPDQILQTRINFR